MSKQNARKISQLTKHEIKILERQLIKEYKKALDNIQLKIMKQGERLGDNFSFNEMQKRKRLVNLKKQILKEINTLQRSSGTLINRLRRFIFRKSFEITSKDVDVSLGKLNTDVVKQALLLPIAGKTFQETMKGLTQKNFNDIVSSITQGLIQGESVNKIARRIKKRMNIGAKRSITIARTETLRAMSQGQLEATKRIEKKGFKVVKVWIHSLLGNARENHLAENGKEANEDGIFILNNGVKMEAPRTSGIAGEDINCRCGYYNKIEEE